MKRALALFALLIVATAVAKDRKVELPALVANAKWVHVTTYHGSNPGNPQISLEDRQAVSDVEQALRKWGRYSVTMRAQDADIILLVHAGAQVQISGGPTTGGGAAGRIPRIGIGTGSEVASSPDDMLAVYSGQLGIDSAPLWRRTAHNGFGSDMALFREFKKAVEQSTVPKP